MSRKEITNERPTDYSKWHREKLPAFCLAQDVDWIEYRKFGEIVKPVAIIETGRWDRTKFIGNQRIISQYIAKKLDVPCFFVEYHINNGNSVFKVLELLENKERIMSELEYKNFIMGL